jgi:hypothetical protein
VLGPSGLIVAATGVLRRSSELGEALDHSLISDYRVDYSIKHMRLVRADAQSATVDIDATIETVTTSGPEVRSRTHAQGPVQVVRESDAWKVADLVIDGVSLRSSFFENGVRGSIDGLTLRVLGGRAFPTFVLAYVELANDLDRTVTVESLTVGQRRSFLPGWRWATGRLPVETFPPGTTRVDTLASLRDVHAAAGIRLLLQTDAGLVDARPDSARARRRVPLSVRYPWAWGTALVTAMVVPLGLVFSWWIAGLALLQVAGVTLLSFQGHLRPGAARPTLLRFAWTLAGVGIGAVLFFANGGFGRFGGESEHERVTKYVERFTGGGVVDARRVFEEDIDSCPYRVWDVHAIRGRWWVVATRGVLPLTPYEHRLYTEPLKVIAARRALADELPGSC